MLDNLINKNIMFLQKYNVKMESEEDKEVYRYGLKVLYSYIIDITIIFTIASYFNRLYETIIMTFLFAILQVFGGGFHADTKFKCSFLMIIGGFIGNAIIGILVYNPLIMLISSIIVSVIIFILVPVTNINHPVEKKVYHRSVYVSKALILIIFFITLLLIHMNRYEEMSIIVSTLYLYCISLIHAKRQSVLL